nr:protein Hook homolog 1-like [Nerophis lumbriciformis]
MSSVEDYSLNRILGLKAANDDYRIHCEELEKQLVEVHHRHDELTGLAEESRSFKDELDALRNCSDRVVMLEASVETYKRKLENLGDLKRQMKLLEENNTIYMQNTVSLKEELRKANAARAQLETYKCQVQKLHMKLSDETRRRDDQDFEMKKLEEKYELVTKEKERIIVERDSLKEIHEELRCTQAQQHQLSQADYIFMLLAALKKKDDDMRAMEERYKMYLEKARNVIRALDPKLNPATAEIQALRNQVADRDEQILNLEHQCEQARLREYEEKLIVSAWCNKSLNFQKLAIESRLGGCAGSTLSSGQSFLSQQRQESNAPRRALSISVPSTTAK